MTWKTQFSELPANFREALMQVEQLIGKEKAVCEELRNYSHSSTAWVEEECERLTEELVPLAADMDITAASVSRQHGGRLQREAERDLGFAEEAVALLAALKNPSQLRQVLYLPSVYFWQLEASMREKLALYQSLAHELHEQVTRAEQPRVVGLPAVKTILKDQGEALVAAAALVAETHAAAEELKKAYLEQRRLFFNDTVDPFSEKPKRFAHTTATFALPGSETRPAQQQQQQQPLAQQSMFPTLQQQQPFQQQPFQTQQSAFGSSGLWGSSTFGGTPAATPAAAPLGGGGLFGGFQSLSASQTAPGFMLNQTQNNPRKQPARRA